MNEMQSFSDKMKWLKERGYQEKIVIGFENIEPSFELTIFVHSDRVGEKKTAYFMSILSAGDIAAMSLEDLDLYDMNAWMTARHEIHKLHKEAAE